VGADYEGLFEHDFSGAYRSPVVEGSPAPLTYGIDQHRLAPDVHKEKGLRCIDCHGRRDVMGDGRTYGYALEVPMRKCEDCHGGFETGRPDPGVEAVRAGEGGYLLRSREGKVHRLPLFDKGRQGHRDEHARVRCSACHAQWSYQDYELNVIREDRIEPHYKWHSLNLQADPYLDRLLAEQVENPGSRAVFSRDRINGQERPGIWSMGWRFRRWEHLPLGVDQDGRYAILRPRHQYRISYVDRLGNTALDGIVPQRGDGSGKGWAFMPYEPHTTAPAGRLCDGCHGDRITLGLDQFEEKSADTVLMIPSAPAVPGMRLLDQGERDRLLEPSQEFRRERLRALQ
jgi:hypothetical protein